MSRGLTAPINTEVAKEIIQWGLLLELGFDSGPVNVWSGAGDITAFGKIFLGLKGLGIISGVQEATDLTDLVIKAQLSQIPTGLMPELVDEVTQEDTTGRPFEIHLAFFDADKVLVDDPVLLTAGFIDAIALTNLESGGGITFDLVSDAALLNRRQFTRLTNDAQQSIFAGDLGLQFVTGLDEQIIWGNAGDVATVGIGAGSREGDMDNELRTFQTTPL